MEDGCRELFVVLLISDSYKLRLNRIGFNKIINFCTQKIPSSHIPLPFFKGISQSPSR